MMRIFTIFFFLFLSLASLAQSVDGGLKTITATVVTTNNYAVTESLPAAYDPKERFIVKFPAANTGAATLNRNGLGAKAIKNEGGTALSSGDIKIGGYKLLSYNGTYYQIIDGGSGGGGGISGLTTGRVPFATSSSTIGDSESIFWDDATKELIVDGMRIWSDDLINGKDNVFIGPGAGKLTVTGIDNQAFGPGALNHITSGDGNVAIGLLAGSSITSGQGNVNIGFQTGNQQSTGDHNIFIGYTTGANYLTGSGSVLIGNQLDAPSTTASGQLSIQNAIYGTGNTGFSSVVSSGKIGFYIAAPSARVHLPAGTATAGTAPLKINGGTLLSSPENYAIEVTSTHLYWTNGSGSRVQIDGGGSLSDGNATTANGTAVDFGGTLTADTNINGAHFIDWGISGTALTGFSVNAEVIDFIAGGGLGGQLTLSNTNADTKLELFDAAGISITLGSGFIFAEAVDYSAYYTDLSYTSFGAVKNLVYTFTNKTIDAGSNTITNIDLGTGSIIGNLPFNKLVNATTSSVIGRTSGVGTFGEMTGSANQVLRITGAGSAGFGSINLASSTTVGASLLPYANFSNGTGLSIVGRSANTSGVQADIVGTANQVLRVSGTTLGFGAVDLAAMVGATVLPVANGGTNIASYAVGDIPYASGATTLSKLADVATGNALISGGVTTAPAWGKITSSHIDATVQTAGLSYLLASGGTFTGPQTLTGTTTNTFKLAFASLGVTQTNGAGIWLQNSTAAAAGAQQESPSLSWEAQGWKTNSTAASQTVAFTSYVLPVQGAANPTGTWTLAASINGAGYSNVFTVDNTGAGLFSGKLNLTGSSSLASLNLGSTGGGNPSTLSANDLWSYGSGTGPDLAFRSGSNTYVVSLMSAVPAAGAIPYGVSAGTLKTSSFLNYVDATALLSTAHIAATQLVQTSAWAPALKVIPGAHTGITASTPKPNILINASTQQWATGALSGQANFEIGAETLSFVGASTATEPTGLLVHAPVVGTNANAFVRPSAITSDGNLFFKTGGTVFGIIGSTTNDAAVAGNVGEEINSNISTYTNFTTTATYQNVTSIALTAGDWDISAFYTYSSNSATITAASNAIFVISTTTASAAGSTEGLSIAYVPQAALLGTSKFSDVIGPYRVSLSGSTTYYLNTQATFTIGNPQYVGEIRARRIR